MSPRLRCTFSRNLWPPPAIEGRLLKDNSVSWPAESTVNEIVKNRSIAKGPIVRSPWSCGRKRTFQATDFIGRAIRTSERQSKKDISVGWLREDDTAIGRAIGRCWAIAGYCLTRACASQCHRSKKRSMAPCAPPHPSAPLGSLRPQEKALIAQLWGSREPTIAPVEPARRMLLDSACPQPCN